MLAESLELKLVESLFFWFLRCHAIECQLPFNVPLSFPYCFSRIWQYPKTLLLLQY